MECNKDEAISAMQCAERKMESGDYKGARQLAQKAQQLFPELENISQLLAVCEVHCSAEDKLGGCEMDWYGILQVLRFSHEAIVKKQYRKLGRLLHPDNNKFAGAEGGLKLIEEANAVLADQVKHFRYDMKCRALLRIGAIQPYQFDENLSMRKHCDVASNLSRTQCTTMDQHQQVQSDATGSCCPFCKTVCKIGKDSTNRLLLCQRCQRHFIASDCGILGVHPETLRNQSMNHTKLPNQIPNKVPSIPDSTGNRAVTKYQNIPQSIICEEPNTFWTQCPSCLRWFQYYRVYPNLLIRCQRCRTNFEAHELMKDVHPETFKNQFVNQKNLPDQIPSKVAPSPGGTRNMTVKGFQNGNGTSNPVSKAGAASDVVGASNTKTRNRNGVEVSMDIVEMSKSGSAKSKVSIPMKNLNTEKGNLVESVGKTKTGNRARPDFKPKVSSLFESTGDSSLCKSMKKSLKRYVEIFDDDDDDFVNPPKRSARSQLPSITEKKRKNAIVNGYMKEGRQKVSCPLEENLQTENSKIISIPDTQFHRFGLDEVIFASLFRANQMWALYDDTDSMPRYYAVVKTVLTPGFKDFKLKIRYLVADPDDQGEIDWCEKDLPVACGKFRLGSTQEVSDHLIFSHQVLFTKGSDKSSFLIYPMLGQTWAMYQNWDIKWSDSEPEKHKPYIYEYVEVLSDFDDITGVLVALLTKRKGFVCLYEQNKQSTSDVLCQVPPTELYRFSHQIPSYKMTGNEGDDVLEGSLELDPAALPTNFHELF